MYQNEIQETDFPFGIPENCFDQGIIPAENDFIVFALEDNVTIDQVRLHHSWSGCCRSGIVEISRSTDGANWVYIDEFEADMLTCDWSDISLPEYNLEFDGLSYEL